MCGIWALFGVQFNYDAFCKIKHRGPNAFRMEYDANCKNVFIGFHRLTIVDGIYGMQPMHLHRYPKTFLICNGELYNCKKLAKENDFDYETYSDVECILHLYKKFGIEKCVENLDGVFAFCIVDMEKKRISLARDPYGVRPLFKLSTKSGILGICSEAKGLITIPDNINESDEYKLEPFAPGTYEQYEILDDGRVKLLKQGRYFSPGDRPKLVPFTPFKDFSSDNYLEDICNLLTMAVKKRLMADREIGCLLSGGLDSSLIASLLVREAKKIDLPYKLKSFSIGMEGSPDIVAARKVAKFIGTEHHEIIFTEEQVASVLDQVIYALETFDITTIRASIPMYLISKYIVENFETTVIFSGEGADEVAQGYIYFRDAPSADEAHADSLRLLKEIYLFDGLRADRTMAAQSLELRVPFLDLQFTNYYLNIPSKLRQPKDGLEKFILRKAFENKNILPDEILWRHKEAFSDGVTSKKKCLFTLIQEIIDKRMPEVFDAVEAEKKYPHCSPKTKEALYYREVFEKSFPRTAENFTPHFWMPRWIEGINDPSARFIKHYAADS